MVRRILWLIRGYFSLLNPSKSRSFLSTYLSSKFEGPFSVSWSQAGEDIALEAIGLKPHMQGFYLDIGAHDPNRFSITRKLYNSGWTGLDIDGNAAYAEKFAKWRPRNKFLNACVGSQDQYVFTIFNEGAISTANKSWVEKFKAEGNDIKKVVKVPGMKLREIMDLPGVPSKVDFINIDIEGADEDAIKSIQFETLPAERFPQWILLETTPPVKSSLDFPGVKYATGFGYVPWLVLPMATLLKAPEKNL